MAATASSCGMYGCSSAYAAKAPATVPAAPMRKITIILPVSRQMRFMLHWSSSGMPSGTA